MYTINVLICEKVYRSIDGYNLEIVGSAAGTWTV